MDLSSSSGSRTRTTGWVGSLAWYSTAPPCSLTQSTSFSGGSPALATAATAHAQTTNPIAIREGDIEGETVAYRPAARNRLERLPSRQPQIPKSAPKVAGSGVTTVGDASAPTPGPVFR